MNSNVKYLRFFKADGYSADDARRIADECFINYYQIKLLDNLTSFTTGLVIDAARQVGHKHIWMDVFSEEKEIIEIMKYT